LTAEELEDRAARCPRCQDPAFLAFPAGEEAKVMCPCGFVANVSDIGNMPADLVEEARVEDLAEDAREAALHLIHEGRFNQGEELLNAIDTLDVPELTRLQGIYGADSACEIAVSPIAALIAGRKGP
jgi:hypothetical protein